MAGKDVEAVYRMLYPKPKPLLQYCRELVRHGELIYYSPNTNSTKPRYFFLFDTALLLTKRTGKKRYWLKIYVHLRHGVTLVDNGPTDTQFRLMVTVKGRSRPIIMYGKNQQHKDLWVRDLKHVLWAANGRKGPDPSLTDSATSPGGSRRGAQQPQQAVARGGKEAKLQQRSDGARRNEEELYSDDDDDDFEEGSKQSDDSGDDDDEEAEVEFMNVKKDKDNLHAQQGSIVGPSKQQEVDRLAHGLDSLVFDPFSDFIPPTATPPVARAATGGSYPPFPLYQAGSGVPHGGVVVSTPFGATAVPQATTYSPFGPVATAPSFAPHPYGNPFAPQLAAGPTPPLPSAPPGFGAAVGTSGPPPVSPAQQQLLYQQQQQSYFQQQQQLQQQLQQLAAIKQQYQAPSAPPAASTYYTSAPYDPFLALAHRGAE